MKCKCVYILVIGGSLAFSASLQAEPRILTSRLHHLRFGPQPEWADFPKQAEGPSLKIEFQSDTNGDEWTLSVRQQDVREAWKVLLNGKPLAKLHQDENDMTICLAVPPGAVRQGNNILSVEQIGKAVDDIRVGQILLDPRPLTAHITEANVEIEVYEGDTPTPGRLTVLDAKGSLAPLKGESGTPLAVRPGVIYFGAGRARFTLPAGEYTIFAGRGFEYSVATVAVKIRHGETLRKTLSIRREVPTTGWISCDPHIHTLTFSGHGDATLDERMLTIAGEGIELPIATDHNRQVDFHAAAVSAGVRKYFTPVIGNELTTSVGHFNIFPLSVAAAAPEFKHMDWQSVSGAIRMSGAKAIILNHPRDLHAGFRPFGPHRHLALTGEDLIGWQLPANAMEVVNSGAQQSDVMRLVHDWLGLLNGGHTLTPVGSSDSHDVGRYIVGQGRTYIRGNDTEPGALNVSEAIDHFVRGKVNVSCGLLTELTIDAKYGPGDLAPRGDNVHVAVRVLGPAWAKADKVELFANGSKIREARIDADRGPGVQWQGEWTLPAPDHDVHYVAVATGPGVRQLYWPSARPYQATSTIDNRRAIGISGGVWWDGDGDGKRSSAFDYAQRVIQGPGDISRLEPFDEAVAAQGARILRKQGVSLDDAKILDAAHKAGRHVERGFESYSAAWRASQIAAQGVKQ